MQTFFTTISAALDQLRRHAIVFLFLISLAALTFLGHDWLAQHDTRVKLESTLAAQQKIVTDSNARQSARDAQLTQTLSQITTLKKSVQTPQQAAAAISKALSQLVAINSNGQPLPSPLEIDLPGADAPNAKPANRSNQQSQISNPNSYSSPARQSNQQGSGQQGTVSQQGTSASAPGKESSTSPTQQPITPPLATLRIPQNDLKPLFDTIEDCQTCRAQLTNAQADLTDERTKSAAIAAQRDATLKSAHGTFWTRIRHNAKWFIIGAAAGAALAQARAH